jgi:hypothetical protein
MSKDHTEKVSTCIVNGGDWSKHCLI